MKKKTRPLHQTEVSGDKRRTRSERNLEKSREEVQGEFRVQIKDPERADAMHHGN